MSGLGLGADEAEQRDRGKQMKTHTTLWVVVAAGILLTSGAMQAQQTNLLETIRQLQERIELLERKVQSLESGPGAAATNQNLQRPAANEPARAERAGAGLERPDGPPTEKARMAPSLSLGDSGVVIASANSNFLMNLHGYMQVDGRFYPGDTPAGDTFLLRRVRPILEGTVYDRFDYRMMPDFSSGRINTSSAGENATIDDAYVNARLVPQFQVQAGKFKSPVGLERMESVAEALFIEAGLPTQMTPNYDVGVEAHNALFNTPVNYAIGIFNGAIDGGSDDMDVNDQGKDVVGRLFFQPFLNGGPESLGKLGFGVAGSVGRHEGPLPSYKTPGQQTFFSYASGVSAAGEQYRIDPQFYYYRGPFGVFGEYIVSSPEVRSSAPGAESVRFNHSAWQIDGTWFVTGDENSFRTTSRHLFHPAHPFKFGGEGWGALELVARVGQMTLDRGAFPAYVTSTSARQATTYGVGLNWYLNSNFRLYLDYNLTSFVGGSQAKGSVTANDEHAILSRVQISF